MGTSFRVANIGDIKNIAAKMQTEADTANSTFQESIQTLTNLTSNMKGDGVDDALAKLQNEVQTLGTSTINVMNEINAFITSQINQYQSANENASANLEQILSKMQLVDATKGKIQD